ncbi:hypothetical protein DWU95_31860 [Burkholderia contaminans]|nr:hypothetical protein DWU95_31860 [Burkholderia contaminans]
MLGLRAGAGGGRGGPGAGELGGVGPSAGQAQGAWGPQGIGGAVIGTAAPVLGELLGRLGGLLPFAAIPAQPAFH